MHQITWSKVISQMNHEKVRIFHKSFMLQTSMRSPWLGTHNIVAVIFTTETTFMERGWLSQDPRVRKGWLLVMGWEKHLNTSGKENNMPKANSEVTADADAAQWPLKGVPLDVIIGTLHYKLPTQLYIVCGQKQSSSDDILTWNISLCIALNRYCTCR